MLKFEHTEVVGWEHAIRGMRNPLESWEKSDSIFEEHELESWPHDTVKTFEELGPDDLNLMTRLRNAGTDHRKFMRMITVYADITAPLYWWKEFDTYKVGTVANSCSTMHKIHAKEFTLEDFSCEHLFNDIFESHSYFSNIKQNSDYKGTLELIIDILNNAREWYLETKDKKYWWQMIQLLPSSYNQKRTVMMNYEVLANIYKSRKNHKLDEWREDSSYDIRKNLGEGKELFGFGFCDWIKTLPYSELITGPDISQIPISNEIMEEAKRRVREEMAEAWNSTPSMSANDFLDKELNIGQSAIKFQRGLRAGLLKDNPDIQKEIYDYLRDLDPKAFDRINAISAEELQAALDLQARTSILETSDNPDISQK